MSKTIEELDLAAADAEAARIDHEPPRLRKRSWFHRKGSLIFTISVFLLSLIVVGVVAYFLFGL